MSTALLASLADLPASVEQPQYDPACCGVGIVHLGLGAFHKAHQAFYTDLAMSKSGGDWKIHGVSLRDTAIPKQINAQNGLYTLITRSSQGSSARVIASLDRATSAKDNPGRVLEILSHPSTKIVSLTITEKGYGIDRKNGEIDESNPVISHDLRHPLAPQGAIGFIVEALRQRKSDGLGAFTVLCCDNLPENGKLVQTAVLGFARRLDPKLANWIENTATFPSTMVDRITPRQTAETLKLVTELTCYIDQAAVETEPFHQWVIEDNFCSGRPDWDKVGAIFVEDVAPYEQMKLRMLNGAHSMLAYGGYLAGHKFVRDVMNDSALEKLIARHMKAASETLPKMSKINLEDYAEALIERFSNPEIAHETYQITTDGSQKMPQRIFEPALIVLRNGQSVRPFAFATALWMHFCRGEMESGKTYEVRDPLAHQLMSASKADSSLEIINGFRQIPGLIPPSLCEHENWNYHLTDLLTALESDGVRTTLEREALR